jgi:molybdopterin-guanine dinucleotide biosynthesis protein A
MTAGCSLLILAGGSSRRMGRDKAALPVGDVPLVEHLARRLSPVVDEIILAGGADPPHLANVRRVSDRFTAMGPLAGMHAGFLEARHHLVWVVGCDLPDVEPALGPLMTGLADDFEAVVPRPDAEPEGVCAVYRRELAPRIEAMLLARERSVKQLLTSSNVRYVLRSELQAVDPELHSFRNLNTPADYEAWIRTR